MKILRFLAPLLLLAATAFGQVTMIQAPGTYTDKGVARRNGTYNKYENTTVLITDTNGLTIPGVLIAGSSPTTLTDSSGKILSAALNTVATAQGGFGADVSASSGVPLFAAGVNTFTSTTGTGTLVRSISPTLTGTIGAASLSLSSLTSGRVPFATTAGLFTDSASLTFNSGTGALTATSFVGTVTGTATNATNGATISTSTNASFFPLFAASSTNSNQPFNLGTGLTFNPSTNNLSTTTFTGALAGNASTATTATNATNTAITDDTTTNATMYPMWVTTTTGNLPAKVASTKLTFNPSTGLLASTTFSGLLSTAAATFSGVGSPSYAAGKLVYDTGNESLTFYNNDSNIGLQVGQESWVRVRNDTGSTIANGIPVYISGAASGLPQITPANANAAATATLVGLTTESISTGSIGYVTTEGIVHDFDTSAFAAGTRLYLGTTAGTLTSTVPSNPNLQVTVGTVVVSNASTGSVMVTPSSGRVAGTLAFTDVANVFTAPQTFTPAARASGVASYFTVNAPTDTGITAATEAIGVNFPTATRTWATTGTVALQRERFFAGPTYASAGASQTFTDAFNSYFTPPIAGTNAIFTRNHTLGIVDSTSAASSITGGLIVATTLGTTATSVGIGGGNVNAGGLITGGTITSTGTLTATAALSVGTTSTFTGVATHNNAVVVNGAAGSTALTITNTARTSGILPYIKYTIPTDTAQTASTESPGIVGVTGTRTWATTGTVALQREIFFPGPTYASASASQTFTDPFNMYLTPPVAGTNAIFTRGHTLGIVDSTSAASSITGGFIVATTLGTTATSVGIGGGNINAGGSITAGGAISGLTFNGNTITAGSSTFTGTSGQTYTFPATTSTLFSSTTKADVLEAGLFAADAGANDTYVITLSPAITAYVTGAQYWFKANTANTGAATLNINGIGAKTIVKLQGAITTTLADNDIRAGQWVVVQYDGTNMQMESQLGNSPTASITGTDTQVLFFDGANNPAGDAGMTYNKTTDSLTLVGTLTTGSGASTAGAIALTQGTTQSTGTTNITIQAPTAVTSYIRTLPGAVGSTGFLLETVSGSVQTESLVAATGTGSVVLSASPTLTGTIGGASLTLSSLTSGRVPIIGASGLLADDSDMTFSTDTLTVTKIGATTFTGVETFTPTARSSGVAAYLTITTPADTAQTASTESIGINKTAATRQWSTGALATQREVVFGAPTYGFVGASTLTDAINVDIADPIAGTNGTLTNKYGLRVNNQKVTGTFTANTGTNLIGPLVDSVDGTTPLNNIIQTVAAGTAYTMTTSSAAVTFGTTSPTVTISNAGTYAVYVTTQLSFVGTTFATPQSATFKLRRTNNTAADLAGSSFSAFLPALTTTTDIGPSVTIGPIKYTTTNTNDSVTVFGILSGATGAGSVTASDCTITAIRMY